jgi:transposase
VWLVQEHTGEHGSQWARRLPPSRRKPAAPPRRFGAGASAERDGGQRTGLTTDVRAELKRLQRKVVELTRATEILKKASAYFAQAELDRRGK